VDREAGTVRGRHALVACLVLATQAAAGEDYPALHARAAEAFGAGDMPAFRDAVGDALVLRPDYPPMLFNLAMAEARMGRGDEALALLGRLARMGLVMPADPEGFPSLAGRPEFDAVAEAFAANARPAGGAEQVARLEGETAFLPEGIAADPATGDLFIGSVREARIVRLDARTGRTTPFAGNDPERLWGVFGMRVAGRRLWVATSAVPQALGLPDSARGRAAVLVYSIDDGTLLFRCAREDQAVFGDVLPQAGGAWVSDSTGGVAFLAIGDCKWRTLVPAGRFVSPQGLTDGGPGRLIVADYRGGLFSVDTSTGEPRRLGGPHDLTLYGIDGLDRAGNWLVAVQNGLRPHRVLALRLSPGGDRITDWRVLAGALEVFDEPTLGVVDRGHFVFVANSGWERYGGEADPKGPPPLILSVPLPKEL